MALLCAPFDSNSDSSRKINIYVSVLQRLYEKPPTFSGCYRDRSGLYCQLLVSVYGLASSAKLNVGSSTKGALKGILCDTHAVQACAYGGSRTHRGCVTTGGPHLHVGYPGSCPIQSPLDAVMDHLWYSISMHLEQKLM